MSARRRALRVLLHAINGVGLGHLARAVAIAVEVRALAPGAQVIVVTNAGDTALADDAGIDVVRLPARLAEPHADPSRALVALPEALHHAAFTAVVEAFRPDVAIFDTHAPRAVVDAAARVGARPALVLRELRPEALSAFVRSRDALAFDAIVMPHEPDEIAPDALPPYPLVEPIGSVLRPLGALPSRRAGRASRGSNASARRDVLVMAGGGGQPIDAARFVQAAADAHRLASATLPGLRTTIVTGPYGEPPRRVFAGLAVVRAVRDLAARIASADLVVSQAGYNAVAELRALGAPAVLVPGHRRMEDQRARALRLARVGAAVVARPDARSIADQIERLLASPDRLAAMRLAHAAHPLTPRNREVARALLAPLPRGLLAPTPSTDTHTDTHTDTVRRVAIVAHDFAPRVGGMETMAAKLAAGLAARGLEVRLLTTQRLGAPGAGGLEGVAIERPFTPHGVRGQIDGWADLLLTIGALERWRPDVVQLTNGGLAPWAPLLRAALGCRVVVTVHGNDVLAPWVHTGLPASAWREAIGRGLRAADAVVAVSSFSADLAVRLGAPRERVTVVPNGVDADEFSPDGPRLEPPGVDPRCPMILTVARLAPRKGHATVLRALARMAREVPSAVYAFTCPSGPGLDDLLALAASLGVADRVVPLGRVAPHDLPALYRRAAAFVLAPDASDDDVEGFGIALLEASASAVAVIGSTTGGVPEAVGDGRDGPPGGLLVPPDDPAALADALTRLLGDADLARSLGEAGRHRVIDRFGWRAAAAGHAAAFDRAMADDALHADADAPLREHLEALRAATCLEGVEHDEARGVVVEARTGAELARRGRERVATALAARERAVERYRHAAARGRSIKLRATRQGAHALAGALADCTRAGVTPHVELRLKHFVDDAARAALLPRVADVHLVHAVPSPEARHVADVVGRLRPDEARRVRTLRVFLDDEARLDPARAAAAAPEVHALRSALARHGVAVMPPPELMHYLSLTPAQRPATAMIEPTNHCNLACPTCPTGTGKIAPLPAMSPERFAVALEGLGPQLKTLALWNYGEPMLHKRLHELIAHAKAAGVGVVKVSTNAHFLDGPRGDRLLSSGLDVLIVSVDGASQATYRVFRREGDFDRVAEQIAWLCAEKRRRGLRRPAIELQFIVMRHNEHELDRVRELAAAWGVDRLRIKTVGVDEANRDLVPASALLSRYREDGRTPKVRHALCINPWDHTVINVDGRVTPCCYLRPDMGDEFVMGNVFDDSFLSIWRGPRYQAFRRAMLEGRASMPVCSTCRGATHDLVASTEQVAGT